MAPQPALKPDRKKSHRNTRGTHFLILLLSAPMAAAATGESSPALRPYPASLVHKGLETESALELIWKRQLGPGNSRIVVSDGLAITLFSDGEFDCLVAFDAGTGEEMWSYRIAPTYCGHDGSRDGPHASPAVSAGVVFGFGPRGQVFAVSLADGREIWSRDVVSELGAQPPFWGFASTPLVEGELVIVPTGGPEGRSVSAFDKKTGQMIWGAGDDAIGYQSPAVMTLLGIRQLVVVTNRLVQGVDPKTGAILWTHQHSEAGLEGSSEAVPIGDERFLLTSSATEHASNAALYELKRIETGFEVREIWSSSALKHSYALPVLYRRHLYGFQRSFLTCVDPESGQPLWKSRRPGGSNLLLAGDKLVILGTEGFVAVAEPNTAGYHELARLQVLDRGPFTAPTFSEGTIFVRNHEEIAAVRLGTVGPVTKVREDLRTMVADVSPTDPRTNTFAAFVRTVEDVAPGDRKNVIDTFLRQHSQFPIVEGGNVAHFVYRGPAVDVAIEGNMTEWGGSDPLTRIPGTDFFYRSYALGPGGRWEYVYEVDFESWIPDPLNPRRAPAKGEEVSELAMPGWTSPEHLRQLGGPGGTLDSFKFASGILDNERDVVVYLPVGYVASGDRYPLLVVIDGFVRLELGLMKRTLDNLIGSGVRPLVVAFLGSPKTAVETFQDQGGPQAYRELGGPLTAQLARALAVELVPNLEERYHIIRRAQARAVMGVGSAGLAAFYAGVNHSAVFGKVAVQSMRLGPTPLQSSRLMRRPVYEAVLARLDPAERLPIEFYVDWASHDLRSLQKGIDLRRDNSELAGMLRRKGYRVAGGEYAGGDGWGSWRARTNEILEAFFASSPRP